jgi:GNAT superfamily N-acetyltransferase
MTHRIRPLDPTRADEIEWVATRMRATLVEVVDPVEGQTMYTMDWLRQRVLWHLDPAACEGQVFVAEGDDGHISGHTIVRVKADDDGHRFGLFSTFYVTRGARHQGLGSALLERGEAWMRGRGLTEAATFTAVTNTPLIALCEGHGYALAPAPAEMVRLSKALRAQIEAS